MYVVAVMPNVFGVENLKKNDMDWEDRQVVQIISMLSLSVLL